MNKIVISLKNQKGLKHNFWLKAEGFLRKIRPNEGDNILLAKRNRNVLWRS